MRRIFSFTLGLLFFFYSNNQAQILDVPICGQEQDMWCGEAAAQAILRYFNVHVTQCELKEFQRMREHWSISSIWGKQHCCTDASTCNGKTSLAIGSEGSIEEMLRNYGAIDCNYSEYPLSLDNIQDLIGHGYPFLVAISGIDVAHAIVCFGVSGSTLYMMNPSYGGYIETYSYNRYVSECLGNLTIKCINQIYLHDPLTTSNRTYIYETAQTLTIEPGTLITQPFYANTTGTTDCISNCIAPSFQLIYRISTKDIILHVRNGSSFSYELYDYTGKLVKIGSGTLSSNDQEAYIYYGPTTYYLMKTITVTSACGTTRTLKGLKIPLYAE